MITSTSNAASANSAADFSLTLPSSTVSSAGSTDPFAQQLATEIEQFLSQSSGSSGKEIDIKISQSQVSAGRQFTVTITEPDTSAATSAAPVGNSLMDAHYTSVANATTPAASTATATATATATGAAVVDKSKMTPDDAYWAEQPPAVQALRNMPPDQVGQAALALAKQGYKIDVPIMVWQWDPLTTMIERQNYGYTWVPSALDSPVLLPPGLSFPGLPNYDPNNGPADAIKVTTDFAKGTNMQDMFVDAATIQASWAD